MRFGGVVRGGPLGVLSAGRSGGRVLPAGGGGVFVIRGGRSEGGPPEGRLAGPDGVTAVETLASGLEAMISLVTRTGGGATDLPPPAAACGVGLTSGCGITDTLAICCGSILTI